jgi:hypothetical protein
MAEKEQIKEWLQTASVDQMLEVAQTRHADAVVASQKDYPPSAEALFKISEAASLAGQAACKAARESRVSERSS